MRDGDVPRFFCAAKRGGRTQLVGQLADPAKQDPAVPAFHDIAGAGRKGKEKRGERTGREGEGRKKVEGMEEDGKLLVEQIKTKKRRVPAPRCIILLSHNLFCLFNDLKKVIDIHKTIRKVGIAENINTWLRE